MAAGADPDSGGEMKVRVLVKQEVEAEVNLDDVMAEIAGLPEPQKNTETLRLLSFCVGAIRRVPDAQVLGLNEMQRRVLVETLRAETERFASLQPDAPSGPGPLGLGGSAASATAGEVRRPENRPAVQHLRGATSESLSRARDRDAVRAPASRPRPYFQVKGNRFPGLNVRVNVRVTVRGCVKVTPRHRVRVTVST